MEDNVNNNQSNENKFCNFRKWTEEEYTKLVGQTESYLSNNINRFRELFQHLNTLAIAMIAGMIAGLNLNIIKSSYFAFGSIFIFVIMVIADLTYLTKILSIENEGLTDKISFLCKTSERIIDKSRESQNNGYKFDEFINNFNLESLDYRPKKQGISMIKIANILLVFFGLGFIFFILSFFDICSLC